MDSLDSLDSLDSMATIAWVVDVGSTFTKASLVDVASGEVISRGETPTTSSTDVMHGVRSVTAGSAAAPIIACSSAGGGLRLAIVGYERTVTAEAAYRVGLSAGAKVVHVAAGRLDKGGIAELRASSPDIVLLVGGTDGGNSEVLQHNAVRLAKEKLPRRVPVVVAGNSAVQDDICALLSGAGVATIRAANVLPDIGVIAPDSARAALREAFLTHVIGGKGLSRDPGFAEIVRMATPDAVLEGVRVLREVADQDVLVVDIGGATTDVYSSVHRYDDPTVRPEVVGQLRHARTVEADLGMRWNAASVIDAAARERLRVSDNLPRYAGSLASRPAYLPQSDAERDLDLELARLAATVAVRRHARAAHPGEAPRDLTEVGIVLGSGGVLRHHPAELTDGLLRSVVTDRAGGWPLPRLPLVGVDTAYLLVVVGLLAQEGERCHGAARAVAQRLVAELPGR
jgi:uncharacterized protein (TIGR01319 family)